MTYAFENCLGFIAPYYNLALVAIVMVLFIYFFAIPNKHKIYDTPWKLLFLAILIFIVEEIMTVMDALGMISFPKITFAFFEMAIISLFIYMCLLQKERVKNG
jgi:hypothetical protein